MTKKCDLAFIVEGQTEQIHFVRMVPKKNIVIARVFSGTTSYAAIAKHVASLMRTFPSVCKRCVIIMDREMRTAEREEIEEAIFSLISKDALGIGRIKEFHIVCPDRMVENWILADVESIKTKKYIRSQAKQRNYEGKDGVREIKKLFVKGVSYDKVSHGVEMLGIINPEVARIHSGSFDKFISVV